MPSADFSPSRLTAAVVDARLHPEHVKKGQQRHVERITEAVYGAKEEDSLATVVTKIREVHSRKSEELSKWSKADREAVKSVLSLNPFKGDAAIGWLKRVWIRFSTFLNFPRGENCIEKRYDARANAILRELTQEVRSGPQGAVADLFQEAATAGDIASMALLIKNASKEELPSHEILRGLLKWCDSTTERVVSRGFKSRTTYKFRAILSDDQVKSLTAAASGRDDVRNVIMAMTTGAYELTPKLKEQIDALAQEQQAKRTLYTLEGLQQLLAEEGVLPSEIMRCINDLQRQGVEISADQYLHCLTYIAKQGAEHSVSIHQLLGYLEGVEEGGDVAATSFEEFLMAVSGWGTKAKDSVIRKTLGIMADYNIPETAQGARTLLDALFLRLKNSGLVTALFDAGLSVQEKPEKGAAVISSSVYQRALGAACRDDNGGLVTALLSKRLPETIVRDAITVVRPTVTKGQHYNAQTAIDQYGK